jgi:hypothetical protein
MKAFTSLRTLVALAAASALAPAALAQAVNGAVDVKVNLTSQCRVVTGATNPVVDFGTYVAFDPAKSGTGATVTFECTRGFGGTPSAAWDTTGGTAAGVGLVSGLQYALTVSGGARTGGTASSVTTIGTGDLVKYTVGGTLAGGQAGDGTGGVASVTRTLLVSF